MLTAQDLDLNNPFTSHQTQHQPDVKGEEKKKTEEDMEEDIGSRLEDAN